MLNKKSITVSSLYRSTKPLTEGSYNVGVKEIDEEGDNGSPLITFTSDVFSYKLINYIPKMKISKNLEDLKPGEELMGKIVKGNNKFFKVDCGVGRKGKGGGRVEQMGVMWREEVEVRVFRGEIIYV